MIHPANKAFVEAKFILNCPKNRILLTIYAIEAFLWRERGIPFYIFRSTSRRKMVERKRARRYM